MTAGTPPGDPELPPDESRPTPGEPVAAEPLPVDGGEHRPSVTRVLLKGTFWQALSQFAPLIINLVLTPYIIHGLGLEMYTIFLIANSVQALMGTFNGGIGPSVTRYLVIYAGQRDQVAATRLVTTMGVVVGVGVLVVFGAFYAFIPAIIDFYPAMQQDESGAAFLLSTQVILLGVLQLRSLFQSVLFAQQQFVVASVAVLMGHLVYTVGLVLTVESGAGLRGIAWTFVCQQALGTLIIVPPAFRHLRRKGIGFIDRALFHEFFVYAGKVQGSSLLGMIGQQADTLIIGKVRPEQMGFFGPGSTFAQQLRTVPLNAVGPMETILGRAVGERGTADALEECRRLQRIWVRGVTGFIAAGAPAAYFGVIAWLHLGSNLPGIVASILLVAHLFSLLPRVQIIWCLVLRRAGFDLSQNIVFLVVKLAATLALIGPFGVVGAVLATAGAQLVANAFLTHRIRARLDTPVPSPWRDVHVPATFLALGLSLALAWGANQLVGPVVPVGPLGLITCGLAAAPAFVLYLHQAVGLGRLRDILRQR